MHEKLMCLISSVGMYVCIFSGEAHVTETPDGSEILRMGVFLQLQRNLSNKALTLTSQYTSIQSISPEIVFPF